MFWNRTCTAIVCFGAIVVLTGCPSSDTNESDEETDTAVAGDADAAPDDDTSPERDTVAMEDSGRSMADSGQETDGHSDAGHDADTSVPGTCTLYEYDEGGDGSIEYRAIEQYVDGRTIYWKSDEEADGTYEVAYRLKYDDQGNLLEREKDADLDGEPERRTNWNYNADGRWTSTEMATVPGGTTKFESHASYNADGNLTEYWRDGEVDEIEVLSEADGEKDYRKTFEWYDDSNLSESRWDTDGDGTFEVVRQKSFDDQGRRTEVTFDGALKHLEANDVVDPGIWEEKDGTVDLRYTYHEWDAEGRPVVIRQDGRFSWDFKFAEKADGTVDVETKHTDRNADGRITRTAYDEGADGSVDVVLTRTWNGNSIQHQEWDGRYGDDLQLMETKDGTPDVVYDASFTSNGDFKRTERDWGNDGTAERIRTWGYDSQDRFVKYTEDGSTPVSARELREEADGTPDIAIELSYIQDDIVGSYSFKTYGSVVYTSSREIVDCSRK